MKKKEFKLAQEDIAKICKFFSLGQVRNFEAEKEISNPHTHVFVFVETNLGQYALKFYPTYARQRIMIENTINRILIKHDFPTAAMHTGHANQPYYKASHHLITCTSYIKGNQAWASIHNLKTIHQINHALLSIKKILSPLKGRLPFLKQESLISLVNQLSRDSKALGNYPQKAMIDASLQDIYQTYTKHRSLFARQWIHNCATLTNFLLHKSTIYVIDLEHVREDYPLSDLASLILSCLSIDTEKKIPSKTIQAIVEDYFTQHALNQHDSLVLNTLIKLGLVREYLKNIERDKSAKTLKALNPKFTRIFRCLADKEPLSALLAQPKAKDDLA